MRLVTYEQNGKIIKSDVTNRKNRLAEMVVTSCTFDKHIAVFLEKGYNMRKNKRTKYFTYRSDNHEC